MVVKERNVNWEGEEIFLRFFFSHEIFSQDIQQTGATSVPYHLARAQKQRFSLHPVMIYVRK